MKSLSQEGILEVWALSPRPIRVRKVGTSGTKGVGFGTESFLVGLADLETERCCWYWCWCWKCCCRRQGVQMYLECDALEGLRRVSKRGDIDFEVAMLTDYCD